MAAILRMQRIHDAGTYSRSPVNNQQTLYRFMLSFPIFTYAANPAMAAVTPWPALLAVALAATFSDARSPGIAGVELASAASLAKVAMSAKQARE